MDKILKVKTTDTIKKEAEKDPSLKFINQYNTGLNPNEFKEFYSWAKNKYGSHDNILREMGSYDIQGAWKAIKNKEIDFDPVTGHLPDTYKKPNHITFSNESKYSNPQTPGGQWNSIDNKWQFRPSKTTIQTYGKPTLQKYLQENESGNDILFD